MPPLDPLSQVSASVLWAAFALIMSITLLTAVRALAPVWAARLAGLGKASYNATSQDVSDPDMRRDWMVRVEQAMTLVATLPGQIEMLRATVTEFRVEVREDLSKLSDQITIIRARVEHHETRLSLTERELVHFADRCRSQHVRESNGLRGTGSSLPLVDEG